MDDLDIKIAKKLSKGSPLAHTEQTVCVYGPSGAGKTTDVIEFLHTSGMRCLYFDLDGNSGPIINAPPAVIENMNYVKLRNSLTQMSVADFLYSVMSEPMLDVCVKHGHLSCSLCKRAGGDYIRLIMDNWLKDYDIVVVDSVTIMVKAMILFSTQQATAEGERNTRAIWQRVSMIANIMMHFLRECHPRVLVTSHPIDVRHEHEKILAKTGNRKGLAVTEEYYMPCFGSVPFSREVARGLSAVIYVDENGKLITDQKKPVFANARQKIQSTTLAGALTEILC